MPKMFLFLFRLAVIFVYLGCSLVSVLGVPLFLTSVIYYFYPSIMGKLNLVLGFVIPKPIFLTFCPLIFYYLLCFATKGFFFLNGFSELFSKILTWSYKLEKSVALEGG